MKVTSDAMSAGGITRQPSPKNFQALTVCPSRRSATNHKMVAREPVTDRLGPRSTPIRSAPVTCGDNCAPLATEPAISPSGKLLIKLQRAATTLPVTNEVAFGAAAALVGSKVISGFSAPVPSTASTSTKSPATRGKTLQEISFAIAQGESRFKTRIVNAVALPARKVGSPNCQSRLEATSNNIAVNAMPPARSPRCVNRKTTKVTAIEAIELKPNSANHVPSDGI